MWHPNRGPLNVPNVKKCKSTYTEKRGYQIGNTKIDLGGDSPVFEIESWNFQQMVDLGISETSQNFSFFFIVSKGRGGPKEKTLKNQCILLAIFQPFSFGNYEKKFCLKVLKFLEVSRNPKSSIFSLIFKSFFQNLKFWKHFEIMKSAFSFKDTKCGFYYLKTFKNQRKKLLFFSVFALLHQLK